MTASLSEAGPRVAMIFVFRIDVIGYVMIGK
jgi:hypothetical protein